MTSPSDGQEGLNKVRNENPELIVLDIKLPKVDGFEVCMMLKNDRRYTQIPIILFTSSAQNSDEKTGHECGANPVQMRVAVNVPSFINGSGPACPGQPSSQAGTLVLISTVTT